MTSRRLDAKIKQYMSDHGVRYQKARNAVLRADFPSSPPPLGLPFADSFFHTSSVEETCARYPDFRLQLGVAPNGEAVVTLPLQQSPHTLIVGGTGSGKTVVMHNLVRQFTAAGFEVHDDPALALAELHQRREHMATVDADEKQDALRSMTPVALTVEGDYASRAKRDMDALRKVAVLGREFRIHLCVTAYPHGQEAESLADNMGNRVLLYPLTRSAVEKFVPIEQRGGVSTAQGSNSRGVGLVVSGEEVHETRFYFEMVEFASEVPQYRDARCVPELSLKVHLADDLPTTFGAVDITIVKDGSPQHTAVVGDYGTGKTVLLHEAITTLMDRGCASVWLVDDILPSRGFPYPKTHQTLGSADAVTAVKELMASRKRFFDSNESANYAEYLRNGLTRSEGYRADPLPPVVIFVDHCEADEVSEVIHLIMDKGSDYGVSLIASGAERHNPLVEHNALRVRTLRDPLAGSYIRETISLD